MEGTPLSETGGSVRDFGESIDNSFKYAYSPPIRCDQCSEVIHQNQPCHILFGDRTITEPIDKTEFRLHRIECQDCHIGQLQFTATGFTSLVYTGQFNENMILESTHFITKSSRSEGLNWNPIKLATLFIDKEEMWETISPTCFVRLLTSINIDPRELIDPDTGDLLVDKSDQDMLRMMFLANHEQQGTDKDGIKALYQSAKQSNVNDEELLRYASIMDEKEKDELLKLINPK